MAESKQGSSAVSAKDLQPEVKTGDQQADLSPANPDAIRERAERLPDRTDVEKAYKDQMTTESPQQEAKASLRISELSIDSPDTPSGYALKESAGESNDTKRGEKYARAKTARRWGYVPVDD